MSISKRELFDKLTRMKQRNRSQCDRMKNLNTRMRILYKVLSENRGWVGDNAIVIDDYFKYKWYSEYQDYSLVAIVREHSVLLSKYSRFSNHVKVRSDRIGLVRFHIRFLDKGFGW